LHFSRRHAGHGEEPNPSASGQASSVIARSGVPSRFGLFRTLGILLGVSNAVDRPLAVIRVATKATAVSKVQRPFAFAGRLPLIGLSCHWDRQGSTSAMWRIADDGGIEQPDGSFLHQRTHTPDPHRHFDRARLALRRTSSAVRQSSQTQFKVSASRALVTPLFSLAFPPSSTIYRKYPELGLPFIR
jgi:hypothetical protein